MNTALPQYDSGIIPAEVAARQSREGKFFGKTAKVEIADIAGIPTTASINTTSGYTIDQEGLANNYAIEPEMYINEPGDLKAEEQTLALRRAFERQELLQDQAGRLTMTEDTRRKGPGRI